MRTKLRRFDEIDQHPRIITPGHPLRQQIRGRRKSDFFNSQNPIVLELACGYGEYTIGLAKQYADRNYIGVDIKGERFWHGMKQADELGLTNVGFVRIIIQNLEELFASGEAHEIRLVHPDPYPKGADERRRLTYRRFLDIYHRLLCDGGMLRFKTDDHDLWHYSAQSIIDHGGWELIDATTDVHSSPLLEDHHNIMTRYERRGLNWGRTICYGVWKRM